MHKKVLILQIYHYDLINKKLHYKLKGGQLPTQWLIASQQLFIIHP